MKMPAVVWMLALALPWGARAQELTGPERQRVLESARSRYYSLTGLGLKSFTCAVKFDLGTLSRGLLPESDTADRALLESARFTLKVTPSGPSLHYQFPQGSVSQSQDVVAGVTLWISEIVQGFFQVWAAKGMSGPIPPEKQVQTVARDGEGFRLTVKGVGGMPAELHLDKDFVVRTMLSRGRQEEIEEHPVFTATPDGLVFAGNESTDKGPRGTTQAKYGIEVGEVDGVRLPRAVHLVAGGHMDVRFALNDCRVTMASR
jgi:hypothetical protein